MILARTCENIRIIGLIAIFIFTHPAESHMAEQTKGVKVTKGGLVGQKSAVELCLLCLDE